MHPTIVLACQLDHVTNRVKLTRVDFAGVNDDHRRLTIQGFESPLHRINIKPTEIITTELLYMGSADPLQS